MSSLIPGFEYDIFISYRQKDNKGERWVNEFVEALRAELESTFKEEINVYFDINPHNGLLETHEVGASLEVKLKCLIFIPIISQTYCDPKSFAWQYEFCAFNKMAKEDQLGRNIRLPGGNVSSRILPVKIHDLDPEDKLLIENELGGPLRGIEFVYKSAGVNRPLRANEDHPHDNLNKTYYRDQINKVANSVKEIINALKKPQMQSGDSSKEIILPEADPSKSLKTKVLAGSLLILALIAIGYFLIPKLVPSNNKVEKSIAVLPFINDSPDQENTYFINGLMDEILNNLQKIKNFRVLSRTSTEKYRGSNKFTIPQIAKELDVNYIVEGSGQKYGNIFRLRVQLIAVKNEKHLWGESFEQEIKETKDIFKIQSQIAQSIAEELKATITPEEKLLIEKAPTTNLTAYDFYQRGIEEHHKWDIDNSNTQAERRSEMLYRKALQYDSTFALAYIGLSIAYFIKETRPTYSENYLDSVLIYANIALSYDDHLPEGYFYRGVYYLNTGNREKALEEYDKTLKYNPNFWKAYRNKGYIYLSEWKYLDYVKALENYERALYLNHGPDRPGLLRGLAGVYGFAAGFPEKARYYIEEALKLDGDSTSYLTYLGYLEIGDGNYESAIKKLLKAHEMDSNNIVYMINLGVEYCYHKQYKESLKYFKKYTERLKSQGRFPKDNFLDIGYAYWQNGYKKEAEYWFNEQKKESQEEIKLGRTYTYDPGESAYKLASLYAFSGEKEKAYEILRMIDSHSVFPFQVVMDLKEYNPLYESIRKEPEFQKIVKDVEAKYQTEHERVRKWLEEQGKL
jgi:TolB-like protein/Tfp pilus assembly protein PilF